MFADEGGSLDRDIVRYEVAGRVTGEGGRMLDVVPEVLPDFLLERNLLVDEIITDLSM